MKIDERKPDGQYMSNGDQAASTMSLTVGGVTLRLTYAEVYDLVGALEYQIGMVRPPYWGDNRRHLDEAREIARRKAYEEQFGIDWMLPDAGAKAYGD